MATKNKDRFFTIALFGAVLALLIMVVCTVINVRRLSDDSKYKEPPRVDIVLTDGVSLDDINEDKSVMFDGNELILTENGSQKVFEDINIRGRGNTTWWNDKKPYRIKFADKVDFLGIGKFKKWAFLAYDLDDSLLRGDLGVYLAKSIDENYPLKGEFVNLYVDDEELGLYYVTPTVSIDKKIVDLKDENGILVEADGAWYKNEYYLKTKMNNYLVGKDSVIEENLEKSLKDFRDSFELFEKATMKKDYDGIKEIVDVDSLVNYYLFSEFVQNYDAYFSSFYFYKDGSSDKIHVGPAWDFDGIAGNRRWRGSREEGTAFPTALFTEWSFEYSPNKKGCVVENDKELSDYPNNGLRQMICSLVSIPEFRESVKETYLNKLSGKREETIRYIKLKADYIREAAIRNNEIWDHGSFDDEVEYLVWWLDKRFDYFDEIYGEKNVNFKIQREI